MRWSWVGLPALVWLGAWLSSSDTLPKKLFLADVAALALWIGVGAFVRLSKRSALFASLFGIAGLLLVRITFGDGGGWFPFAATCTFFLAVAFGLASVGRAIGVAPVVSGVAPLLVLSAACVALYWIDPASTLTSARDQFPLRQALLHIDPSTMLAYASPTFDRFHDAQVYDNVPLAASLIRPTTWSGFALAWGPVAALLACLGAWLERDSFSRSIRTGNDS